MSNDLPVLRKHPSAAVQPSHTQRAGLMVGLSLAAVLALGTFGFGWAALLSALVPIAIGAGAAGTVERSRRWSRQLDSSVPLALGGAWLGLQLGAVLAPFWALCAGILGVGGALFPPFVPWGTLFFAGAALGAMAGAATGVAVGARPRKGDPLTKGAVAGASAAVLVAGGVYTGAFGALAGLVGSWLGADPVTLAAMLTAAPGLVGGLGMAAVAGTAAFAGTLTLEAAAAREKHLSLPDPGSFPSWARSDSVSGFHRDD